MYDFDLVDLNGPMYLQKKLVMTGRIIICFYLPYANEI